MVEIDEEIMERNDEYDEYVNQEHDELLRHVSRLTNKWEGRLRRTSAAT